MAVKKLTEVTVRNLKAPVQGRLEIWDALLRGFGIRITEKDARSYFVMYWIGPKGQRKQRRLTLGDARVITLSDARDTARRALESVARGIDPATQRFSAPSTTGSDTLRAVIEAYLSRQAEPNTRRSTFLQTKRTFDVDVIPVFGAMPIAAITRRDIDVALDTIIERGAKVQANRTLARLRALFNWAVSQEYLASSPVDKIRPRTKEHSRERTLSDPEILAFWRSCDQLSYPFGPLCQILLLTAQRRTEVATMEWTEIDFDARVWTIPRHKAKNDHAHRVDLSDLTVELLHQLPRISDKFVFTTTGISPVSGFSRAKCRLDRLMTQDVPNLEPWIFHDLRRTAATRMASLRVDPHVVDKILNHITGTIRGVAAIYNRFGYSEQRQSAMNTWGRFVSDLVLPTTSNVVALRA